MAEGRAIVYFDTHENGGWKMQEIFTSKPGKGELLVEMVASGICHTDVLIGGIPGGAAPIAFYPRVLGHEGSGYGMPISSSDFYPAFETSANSYISWL